MAADAQIGGGPCFATIEVRRAPLARRVGTRAAVAAAPEPGNRMTEPEGETPMDAPATGTPFAPLPDPLAQGLDLDDASAIDASLPPVARVTRRLNAEAPRIIANWALRVANLPAFRAVPDLGLAQLQDAVPDLLAASLTAIATPDPDLDLEPDARAEEAARHHARTRAGAGFGIDVVLAELQQLRAEITAAAWRIADDDPTLTTLPREIQDRVYRTTDGVMLAAAAAWVAAQRTPEQADPTARQPSPER